jgi:ABC-type spermidine/putrescine transport system permease subunit I
MILAIITVVLCLLGFPLAVAMAAHIEGRTSPTAR